MLGNPKPIMDPLPPQDAASSTHPPNPLSQGNAVNTSGGGRQKIVESGREHTGRWTKEEHEAFLAALQQYGKEWKKVAAKVKTRTVVQTRTHAQKYFQKLSKVLEGEGGMPLVEGGVLQGSGSLSLGSSSAAIMNAQSLAAMMDLGVGPGADKKKSKKPSPVAKKSQSKQRPPPQIQQTPQQTPRTTSTAEALLNMSAFTGHIGDESYRESDHHETWHNFYSEHPPTPYASTTPISIKAPTYDNHDENVKFPEPSPAACGKRKVAEIAAAQMLVGVSEGSSEGFTPNPILSAKRGCIGGTASDVLDEGFAFQTDDDAFLAEVFGVDTAVGGGSPYVDAQDGLRGTRNAAVLGNTLQIVNPDTLEEGSFKKRCINGQASPSTPWDGQLEALVSHVHQQESQENNTEDIPKQMKDVITTEQHIQPIPLPLRNPSSDLHLAISKASIQSVEEFLSNNSAQSLIHKPDDMGYHPLHMACALGMLYNGNEGLEITYKLIDGGADVLCRDKDGNTPLHWAARSGHVAVLRLLLSRNCPMDSQNDANETALHWAMRSGSRGMAAVQLLVESGARANLYNRSYKRALDVAAEGFSFLRENETVTDGTEVVNHQERRATRWNLLNFSSQCRTLVLHHHECLEHMTKSDHDWEVPDRIDSIMSTLANRTSDVCPPEDECKFKSCEITVSNEFDRATLELLSRIHSANYLAFVNDLSKELDRKRKQQLLDNAQQNTSDISGASEHSMHVVPFTPMVQKKFIKEAMAKADGNSDTSFSAGSLKAARRAAGAVQHAVDCVLVGRNRNAFCVVRPPGHHAGINGLLSNAESCGFCLFNNVAAGAMHALSDEKHRPRCERCAIVDIDAHHGNGTEEIVRKCHDSGRLLFFSVHLYDSDKPKKTNDFNYKFYPGTGADDDVPHNVINVPIAPLWREKEIHKSISTSPLNGLSSIEPRQTRLKTKADSRVSSSSDLKNMVENDSMTLDGVEIKNLMAKPKQLPSSSPHYPSHYLMGVGRLAYRRAIESRLLPALRAFNPDLIIMSTGFDAARGDVGNARHFINGTQAMGLDLEPEDYAWTSRKICEVADICCNGRVVSVLEGGYGRTPSPIPPPPLSETSESTEEVRQPLEKSFFSECAMHHLKGLVDPYCTE